MVIFWDASALIPLIVRESQSETLLELWSKSDNGSAWILSKTEIFSGLCRLKRENRMDDEQFQKSREHWQTLTESITFIKEVDVVQKRAERILQIHSLKAADALQLSAALIGCMDETTHRGFVTLDGRLAESARKEGFEVFPQR